VALMPLPFLPLFCFIFQVNSFVATLCNIQVQMVPMLVSSPLSLAVALWGMSGKLLPR
jgi:hypothetical protein